MMRARTLPLLLAFLAALAWVAGSASAGDDERRPARGERAKDARSKDHVAELEPKELAFLKSRIKNWDKLEAGKKQMIARNVVRLRNMSPEQRKHFERRLRSMREKPKQWDRMRDHGGRMLVDRGLAHAARKQLGREFEARLRRSDISEHVFERSFSRTFWDKVTEAAFQDGQPVPVEALPKDLPERFTQRYAQMHAKWSAAEDPDQRKRMARALGGTYSHMLAGRLRQELARSDVQGSDAYVALVARTVRQTWPKEFAESVQDPDALLRSAENYEVRRSLFRLLRRDGKLMGEEAVLLVRLVERFVLNLPKQGEGKDGAEAGAEADALIKRVLREQFKVEAAVLETLPPRAEVQKRAAWYSNVLGRKYARMRGMRGGGPRNGKDGRKGPGGRTPAPLQRPEGLSDADWTAFQQATKAAGRPFLRTKPDGMSAEGWALIKAAFKKRMEGFARRRGGG
jgi:hypothetical protein